MKKQWKVRVPNRQRSAAQKAWSKKLGDIVKTVLAGAAVSAVYFGIIAILMMPVVDLA